MNCLECCDNFAAYLEHLLDNAGQAAIELHLAECPQCRAELDEVRHLTERLASQQIASSPISLETAVMNRILHEQALEIRRLKMRKRLRVLGISGATAAMIAVMLVGSYWFAQPAAAETERAAKVLAQGAEAVSRPSTVHILTKMRTPPGDNFAHIDPRLDFAPIEVWRQFGDKPKWRMEEPGRIMVMDGTGTVGLLRPSNTAHKDPRTSDDHCGPALELTKIHDMIARELSTALAKGWDLKLTHETTAAGEKKLVVTVEAKAGLPDNDYLKNKYLDLSDVRRVYRFDAKTQRLEGFDAYLHEAGGDVLVLTIEKIEYDLPIDPSVFTLKLPDNVQWYKEPEKLPDNEKYEKMTPKEAAQAFFEACEKRNWPEVEKFSLFVDERSKNYLGGLKLVSLGKPFQSKGYAGGHGWFVPYEIRLTAKATIMVRNDNAAKRYLVFIDPDRAPNAKTLAEVKKLPDNEKYEKMTPKEAAQAFFNAWARKDLDGIRKLVDDANAGRITAKDLEDRRYADVRVGEPTKAKDDGCWNVPIEIRFTHKHNLALRNDTPAKRYIVDGGI